MNRAFGSTLSSGLVIVEIVELEFLCELVDVLGQPSFDTSSFSSLMK
jgi:hypothetical protein